MLGGTERRVGWDQGRRHSLQRQNTSNLLPLTSLHLLLSCTSQQCHEITSPPVMDLLFRSITGGDPSYRSKTGKWGMEVGKERSPSTRSLAEAFLAEWQEHQHWLLGWPMGLRSQNVNTTCTICCEVADTEITLLSDTPVSQ